MKWEVLVLQTGKRWSCPSVILMGIQLLLVTRSRYTSMGGRMPKTLSLNSILPHSTSALLLQAMQLNFMFRSWIQTAFTRPATWPKMRFLEGVVCFESCPTMTPMS
uniref:Putative secreted protein n=1 Tax=Ixodes ricinus TaxID=34613 RepID=A0A147BSV9_IXORI